MADDNIIEPPTEEQLLEAQRLLELRQSQRQFDKEAAAHQKKRAKGAPKLAAFKASTPGMFRTDPYELPQDAVNKAAQIEAGTPAPQVRPMIVVAGQPPVETNGAAEKPEKRKSFHQIVDAIGKVYVDNARNSRGRARDELRDNIMANLGVLADDVSEFAQLVKLVMDVERDGTNGSQAPTDGIDSLRKFLHGEEETK